MESKFNEFLPMGVSIMKASIIFTLLFSLGVVSAYWFFLPYLKKKWKYLQIHLRDKWEFHATFGYDMERIKEEVVRDEVVRIVNYLGKQAAQACTRDDKHLEWFKHQWWNARKRAHKAAPELMERMPFFRGLLPKAK